MKLAIRVGKGDPVEDSGLEPRTQGCAVAAILRMPDQPNMRKNALNPLNDLTGGIAAAVVYD
jgi:hypothetical protein